MKIKNLGIFILIAVLFFVLLVFVHFVGRLQTEPIILTEPLTDFDQQISVFDNIVFSGPLISVPVRLPIVEIESRRDFSQEIIADLINAYELTQVPDFTIWFNAQTDISLSQTTVDCFSLDLPLPAASEPGNWSVEDITASAFNFISDRFNVTNVTPLSTHIIYHPKPFDVNPTGPNLATVAIIPFAYLIEDIPVFSRDNLNPPFLVHLNNNGETFKVDFCPQIYTFAHGSMVPTISISQAIVNINRVPGVVSILNIAQEDWEHFDPLLYTSGSLTSVSLEYRIDDANGIAYPFYRFSGTLYDQNNVPVNVELITPAVQVVVGQ